MADDIYETPSTTPNFQTELAAQLADLIPEAIADGKVDVEKLKELLDGDVADGSERFGLFWPGKKRALRAAQEPTTATLKPDFENSKDWDATQNVFIEGDNLEVLKILQKHYHAKIKMIYIDPPYNTGKDFVYPDNYKEGLDTYLEWTRQVNEEGKKVTTNAETEGRYHSNWLNMMYPRLKLARNLLADDGLIFVSISDAEHAQLYRLLVELFGEGNFIETFVWQSIFRPSNMSRRVRRNAEYILCFAKDSDRVGEFIERLEAPKGEPSLTQNNNSVRPLEFPEGSLVVKLPDGTYPAGEFGEIRLESPLIVEAGVNAAPVRMSGRFKWSQSYLNEEIAKGVHLVIKTKTFIPYYRKDYQETSLRPTKILPRDLVGDVLQANAELDGLNLRGIFDYPKPTSLVGQLAKMIGLKEDDIFLDFFAGSASAGDALMRLNSEDRGSRRYILVQLPEPTAKGSQAEGAGFRTIADVARARLDRAGEHVRKSLSPESPPQLDIGYRAYKLVDTNFAKWRLSSDVEEDTLQQHLLSLRDSATDDASADDLLTEILLKQGYSLTEAVAPAEIGGLDIRLVRDRDGDIAVLAYLNEHVKPTLEQLRALVDESPTRIIVLEDAFQGDDELKTNLTQLAKSKGIELWTA